MDADQEIQSVQLAGLRPQEEVPEHSQAPRQNLLQIERQGRLGKAQRGIAPVPAGNILRELSFKICD